MKVIVGLGNPGEQYSNTRHNLGFMVLDRLLEDLTSLDKTYWENDKNLKSLTKKVKLHDQEVLLIKPQTYMNNSGEAIGRLLSYYKLPIESLYVVYDDLDLPLGKTRVRFGGAAGGHRGVESIINHLKDDKFLRLRLGIGRPTRHEGSQRDRSAVAVDEYVLAPFTPSEKSKVRTMTHQIIKSLKLIVEHGIEGYMSKHNKENQIVNIKNKKEKASKAKKEVTV